MQYLPLTSSDDDVHFHHVCTDSFPKDSSVFVYFTNHFSLYCHRFTCRVFDLGLSDDLWSCPKNTNCQHVWSTHAHLPFSVCLCLFLKHPAVLIQLKTDIYNPLCRNLIWGRHWKQFTVKEQREMSSVHITCCFRASLLTPVFVSFHVITLNLFMFRSLFSPHTVWCRERSLRFGSSIFHVVISADVFVFRAEVWIY